MSLIKILDIRVLGPPYISSAANSSASMFVMASESLSRSTDQPDPCRLSSSVPSEWNARPLLPVSTAGLIGDGERAAVEGPRLAGIVQTSAFWVASRI